MSDTCCSIIRTVEEKIRLIRVGVPGPAGVDGRNGDLAPMHGTLAEFNTFATSGTAEPGQVFYILQQYNSRIQVFDTPSTVFTWLPSFEFMDDRPYLGDPTGNYPWNAIDPTTGFQNSWQNEGSGLYHPAEWVEDPFGSVHLRGHVEAGSLGVPMFTLPGPVAPSKTLIFPVVSNGTFGVILINVDGEVICVSGSSDNVSLDNIQYEIL